MAKNCYFTSLFSFIEHDFHLYENPSGFSLSLSLPLFLWHSERTIICKHHRGSRGSGEFSVHRNFIQLCVLPPTKTFYGISKCSACCANSAEFRTRFTDCSLSLSFSFSPLILCISSIHPALIFPSRNTVAKAVAFATSEGRWKRTSPRFTPESLVR